MKKVIKEKICEEKIRNKGIAGREMKGKWIAIRKRCNLIEKLSIPVSYIQARGCHIHRTLPLNLSPEVSATNFPN